MSDLVTTLKRPVGPLPLGAWFIVVGAGVGIGLAGRKRFGSSSASSADTASSSDTTSTDPTLAAWTNPGQVGVQSDSAGSSGSSGPAPIYTNEEWRTAAIKIMVDRGTPPDVAMSAVSKLYAGTPMSADEYAAINLAVRSLGPPPAEVPPMTRAAVSTTPVPAPATVPAATTRPTTSTPSPLRPRVPAPPARPRMTYTVRSGDTLSGLGAKYGVPWSRIYDANAGTIEATARSHGRPSSDHGHWIYPGETLVIP